MAARNSRLAWEGFGPTDPESGRARGEPEPVDPTFGPPTKADNAHFRRQARANERELARQHSTAARPPRRPSSRPAGGGRSTSSGGRQGQRRAAPSLGPLTSSTTTRRAPSFVLGLVVYAVGLNYVKYGWAGVQAWASAKFTNKVIPGPWGTAGPAVQLPVQSAPGNGAPTYLPGLAPSYANPTQQQAINDYTGQGG